MKLGNIYIYGIPLVLGIASYFYYFKSSFSPAELVILRFGGAFIAFMIMGSLFLNRGSKDDTDIGTKTKHRLKRSFIESENFFGSVSEMKTRFWYGYVGKHAHAVSAFTLGGDKMGDVVIMGGTVDDFGHIVTSVTITNPTQSEALDPRSLITGPYWWTTRPTDEPIEKQIRHEPSTSPLINIEGNKIEEKELMDTGNKQK